MLSLAVIKDVINRLNASTFHSQPIAALCTPLALSPSTTLTIANLWTMKIGIETVLSLSSLSSPTSHLSHFVMSAPLSESTLTFMIGLESTLYHGPGIIAIRVLLEPDLLACSGTVPQVAFQSWEDYLLQIDEDLNASLLDQLRITLAAQVSWFTQLLMIFEKWLYLA